MQIAFLDLCSDAKFSKIKKNSIGSILTASFETLVDIALEFERAKATKKEIIAFEKLFNYDKKEHGSKQQQKISAFFIKNNKQINICTCYFCNIDFVNSFVDGADYTEYTDFILKAPVSDLTKISGVTKDIAKEIEKLKGKYSADSIINKLEFNKDLLKIKGIGEGTLNSIKLLEFKKQFSHFTLDHVLNKAKYPIVALSLFNFVPCCYSCNSKFKRDQPLVETQSDSKLSPTSINFTFDEDVLFTLFYKSDKSNISKMESIDDFSIRLVPSTDINRYYKFIEIFKLNARYKSHKGDVLELINKAQKYNEKKIIQISELVGGDISKIKEDIFGSELFDSNLSKKPKSKLMKDIGKGIELI
jgi:hypothetical protein